MAEKTKNENSITELVKTLVYALLLAGIIRTFFFQPFWIPSGSMKDTLLVGDFLFVNKMSYGYSWASCPTIRGVNLCGFLEGREGRILGGEPERGDVIVFKHPTTKADFIKRLIGLPGDRIQMKNGVLQINGEPVKIEAAGTFEELYEEQGPLGGRPSCEGEGPNADNICVKSKFIETLPNGVAHSILNIRNQRSDNTGVFTVPEGQYFFMGDNRDNSADSRISIDFGGVGFVDAANIVGRADRVMFSSAGRSILAFWTWRSDRYFKAIK